MVLMVMSERWCPCHLLIHGRSSLNESAARPRKQPLPECTCLYTALARNYLIGTCNRRATDFGAVDALLAVRKSVHSNTLILELERSLTKWPLLNPYAY